MKLKRGRGRVRIGAPWDQQKRPIQGLLTFTPNPRLDVAA